MKILITGGAGFIGSHVVRLFVEKYPNYHIFNLDALTYAGNLENLKDIEHKENYTFLKCDICDFKKVKQVFLDYTKLLIKLRSTISSILLKSKTDFLITVCCS